MLCFVIIQIAFFLTFYVFGSSLKRVYFSLTSAVSRNRAPAIWLKVQIFSEIDRLKRNKVYQ